MSADRFEQVDIPQPGDLAIYKAVEGEPLTLPAEQPGMTAMVTSHAQRPSPDRRALDYVVVVTADGDDHTRRLVNFDFFRAVKQRPEPKVNDVITINEDSPVNAREGSKVTKGLIIRKGEGTWPWIVAVIRVPTGVGEARADIVNLNREDFTIDGAEEPQNGEQS